ncbi:DNA-binding response regulator [Amycolatopsis sp. NPDC005003]
MAVRIAIVDPLPMFRTGVVTVLDASGYEVDTPAEVVSWVRHRAGSVVLLTLRSKRDWDLLAQLCAIGEAQVVIALLEDESPVVGARAVRIGARAVLPREVDVTTLVRTVDATVSGQAVMPASVAAALADDPRGEERTLSSEQLSWLRQLASGMTVARLADQAGYSERAMFRLLQALYRQMGVETRLQAIMRAKEAGWC